MHVIAHLLLHILTLSLIMGTKEKSDLPVMENGAGGGLAIADSEDDTVPQEEFDKLCEKLNSLNQKSRRHTMHRLSTMYSESPGEKPFTPPPQDHENVTIRRGQAVNETQNVIVQQQTDRKLPRFSGSVPPSHGEVSFRRWQRAANRLLEEKDDDVSEVKKKSAILRSLNGTADDIVEIYRHKSSIELVEILEKKYGGTIDGDDLLVEFYTIFQSEKQSASDYLSELFVELGDVVKYEGVPEELMDVVLLKQFIRGTSDDEIMNKLRLEDQVKNPPSFPDLISSIRREETKRAERKLRHKQQVRARAAVVSEPEVPAVTPPDNREMHRMQQRLAELESLAASIEPGPAPQPPEPSAEFVQLQQRLASVEQKLTVRKRNIFCYRCGQDAHMATECENPANKKLVEEKVAARRQRQNKSGHLN